MKKSTPPPLKFLFAHPAHFIACGCGSGLSTFAPGTVGTLFAWLTFPLFGMLLPSAAIIFATLAVLFILGVIAADITGRHLGVTDHGSIVWDEIVPFWTVLLFVPAGFSVTAFAWQLLAFLAFRFFDIIKPFPANWFDRQIKNGFGVMMDDVIAAGYTVLVLLLAQQLWSRM
ncbi:MAG: phosphatidylglycerophosphatase A [Georgfuchsia sp.]